MTFEAKQSVIIRNCYALPSMASAFQDQIRRHMERAQFSRPDAARPVIKRQADDLGVAATRMLLTFWRETKGEFQPMTPADLGARLGISPQSVANNVKQLHVAGCVTLKKNRDLRLWSLTERGKAKARKLMGMEPPA